MPIIWTPPSHHLNHRLEPLLLRMSYFRPAFEFKAIAVLFLFSPQLLRFRNPPSPLPLP